MGHTTFVLAKNILTCPTVYRTNVVCPNLILSRNGCSHLYFVERRGAWVQPWAYLGERFTGSKPPIDFFTIHNKIQCHVMSKPKPQSESQNSIFLWLCLWFNSNVDAIITNLFCEHAFCQDSSRKQNNPTSASSVIIFINPT